MAARIISRPSGITDKVLRRSDYAKEMVGLETLTETYTILTSARLSIQPSRNTLHSTFSSASTKFPRMAVETLAFKELDGDITEMTVTYVGLTSSTGLPPAIVQIIPSTGAGVFGPPVVIQAQYITDLQENQLLAGRTSSASDPLGMGPLNNLLLMPRFINGTEMPNNPREPFFSQTPAYAQRYDGYVINNLQSTRRGLFLVVTANYQEQIRTLSGIPGKLSSSNASGRNLTQKSWGKGSA